MDEQGLRGLIADVKRGKLSRRAFINRMIAYGLTAPFAMQMLTYSGVAQAQTKPDPYKPTKRGGGGLLKVLWWDGQGLCLFAKRLERGRFLWPQAKDGSVVLTPAQLSMLLEGIDWRAPRRTWAPEAAG